MPVSDKYKCIYFHNAKAGGSSIEQLIRPITYYNDKYDAKVRYAPQHLPCEELKKLIPPEKWRDYFKFTVIRNPWDRALSDYFWNNRGFKKLCRICLLY